MSIWENVKQILDALAYFGGLAIGVSLVAFALLLILTHFFWDDVLDYDEDRRKDIDERY